MGTSVKIAHVTTVDTSLSYLLLNQMKSIQKAGYAVSGISSPGSETVRIQAAGIRHIPVEMTRNVTPVADLAALWQLYRTMCQERFTIVHVHTPKAELLGTLAARMAGVPVIVDTYRGIYYRSDMHPNWRWLFFRLAQIAAARADVVLSQSREAMQIAIKEGMCPEKKIRYLGNGIDVLHFDRDRIGQKAVNERRREFGIPFGAPVIGFVGRLVKEKGVLEFLQAARRILDRLPRARFLLVGPVDSEKPDAVTPQIARRFGVEDTCIFAGMRRDMPELYALMNVFVLPSHREGFPRSPMEASAMRVPCVVTDIPGCRETVEHYQNGILVPLGDAESLAAAVLDILSNPETARSMGEKGHRMAQERFDERKVFAKVKNEYARLLSEKGLEPPGSPRC